MENIKIISAGAGSGKTYRLTAELVNLLKPSGDKTVRASGIIATTFTKKAAAELQERVRIKLLEDGLSREADEIANAMIGTVHGLGVKLLKRFAFEAGVSPEVAIIADEDQQVMFNQSLSSVLNTELIREMEELAERLGLNKNKERYDWRKDVKRLTDQARGNNFSKEIMEKSKRNSIKELLAFFPPVSKKKAKEFNQELMTILDETIIRLENGEDSTKVTQGGISTLRSLFVRLRNRGELNWHDWVKITKLKVGAKSRHIIEKLVEIAQSHQKHPRFQEDLSQFIGHVFEVAIMAMEEYDAYKKRRGLIDYTDMEVAVLDLLDISEVSCVLEEELDLLMVDEFQDTNPIQLEIFLKLSNLAGKAIWVGDPKQSIYGFRGAEPELMQAIMEATGGVNPEDIQEHSWRSREEIVAVVNAIFCKAFAPMPEEQIRLKPKRTILDNPEDKQFKAEPIELETAVKHWRFYLDEGGKRPPGKPWMENCTAESIRGMLEKGIFIIPKGEITPRPAKAGDVAILCRSNSQCQELAEALYKSGIKAAISGAGLLQTAEAKAILACLKFILQHSDSLSIAEVLLLIGGKKIDEIVDNRLAYLEKTEKEGLGKRWGRENPTVKRLMELRMEVKELSGAEILNLVIEDLELRKVFSTWGNVEQRLDNVDALRKQALAYEETCNRLHTAASLGGLLLWFNELEANDKDLQGSGEGADAVNVLTYHRSKGLEWPIVICYGLEGTLRDSVWGTSIVQESSTIDLSKPLANRWLRYWVNPYADQGKNTELEAKLSQSSTKKIATEKAMKEEIRLLYVGLTRARDYLIFPTKNAAPKWLNRVCNGGNEKPDVLIPENPSSPWVWNGKNIPLETISFHYPKNFTRIALSENSSTYFDDRVGQIGHDYYHIDIEKESKTIAKKIKIHTLSEYFYSEPLSFKEDANEVLIVGALHDFFRAENYLLPEVDRIEWAEAILQRHGIEDQIRPNEIIRQSDAFFRQLNELLNVEDIHSVFPVSTIINKRLFEDTLDWLVETPEGIAVILNVKDFQKDKKGRINLTNYAARLFFLEQCFPKLVGLYLHFVLKGELRAVKIEAFNHQLSMVF